MTHPLQEIIGLPVVEHTVTVVGHLRSFAIIPTQLEPGGQARKRDGQHSLSVVSSNFGCGGSAGNVAGGSSDSAPLIPTVRPLFRSTTRQSTLQHEVEAFGSSVGCLSSDCYQRSLNRFNYFVIVFLQCSFRPFIGGFSNSFFGSFQFRFRFVQSHCPD